MNENLEHMLNRYQLKSSHDCTLAIREIIQEIALVGLWRAKFFEKAAFYGGTALRILYGLDRYSEDLDFSLLKKESDFALEKYNQAVKKELESYGFSVNIETKEKTTPNSIESAFIKANTYQELLRVGIPALNYQGLNTRSLLKIKLEVDTNPPGGFSTENRTLTDPVPISIRTYVPADLFAGKMHALLCRLWQNRIKGRDWYDFVWYVRRKIPLNLQHLQERMWQSGCLSKDVLLTPDQFNETLGNKISSLNIEKALRDIKPFISDPAQIASWSKEYFLQFAAQIIII